MNSKHYTKFTYGGSTVGGVDLTFKTIHEDWNLYELEDGSLIKAKLIAHKIARGIDPKTGDILRVLESGEPLYDVRYSVVIVAQVPKELMEDKPNSGNG